MSRIINQTETSDDEVVEMIYGLLELDPNQLETKENANLNDLWNKVQELWKELC